MSKQIVLVFFGVAILISIVAGGYFLVRYFSIPAIQEQRRDQVPKATGIATSSTQIAPATVESNDTKKEISLNGTSVKESGTNTVSISKPYNVAVEIVELPDNLGYWYGIDKSQFTFHIKVTNTGEVRDTYTLKVIETRESIIKTILPKKIDLDSKKSLTIPILFEVPDSILVSNEVLTVEVISVSHPDVQRLASQRYLIDLHHVLVNSTSTQVTAQDKKYHTCTDSDGGGGLVNMAVEVDKGLDMRVTDPDGYSLSKHDVRYTEREVLTEVSGQLYLSIIAADTSGRPTISIYSPKLKRGTYVITVPPDKRYSYAPDERFTLKFFTPSACIFLANNQLIKDIPESGYQIAFPVELTSP